MITPVQPSPQSQKTLRVLQQAVTKALDRKQRLGQYAVVWQDGAPVRVGGEINNLEILSLLAEKTFLEEQLTGLPELARLTRMSTVARLKNIEALLAQKRVDKR
jgi:hypothetical protein